MRRRHVRKRIRREIVGMECFMALQRYGRLTHRDLEKITGFDRGRVARGLNWIREVGADLYTEPLCYDPSTHEYAFAGDVEEARDYLIYRLTLLLKWIHNLRLATADPALMKFAGRSYLRWLHTSLIRAEVGLHDQLETLGARSLVRERGAA